MGWRYLLFALGGMTLFLWAVRFFVFPLEESPRFLVGRGRDEEADDGAGPETREADGSRPTSVQVMDEKRATPEPV